MSVCSHAVEHGQERRSQAWSRHYDPEAVQFDEPASRLQVRKLHIAMIRETIVAKEVNMNGNYIWSCVN